VTRTRIQIVVLGALITIIGTAGVAAAAWGSSATGSATVKAASASSSTITANTPITADNLYPGATKHAFVTIDNPNPYPVIVTGIGAGSSATQGACVAGTATTDAVVLGGGATAVVQSDNSTTTIAANGSGIYQLTSHMISTADNSCQGLTFSLSLTATLQSNA
jgi:hypothetical protein